MADDMQGREFKHISMDCGLAPVRNLRILLADDDDINREIVAHLVRDLTHVVLVTANDGRAALEFALTQKFDLLIFDLNMPEINGDRLIRHLRASQSLNASSPMILFTAWAGKGSNDKIAGSVGSTLADMILPKPIRAEQFISAINTLTRRNA